MKLFAVIATIVESIADQLRVIQTLSIVALVNVAGVVAVLLVAAIGAKGHSIATTLLWDAEEFILAQPLVLFALDA